MGVRTTCGAISRAAACTAAAVTRSVPATIGAPADIVSWDAARFVHVANGLASPGGRPPPRKGALRARLSIRRTVYGLLGKRRRSVPGHCYSVLAAYSVRTGRIYTSSSHRFSRV